MGDGEIIFGNNVYVADEVVIECFRGGILEVCDCAYIAEGAYLTVSGRLRIGLRAQVCNRSLVQAMKASIVIGDNSYVAHGCNIKTTTHEIDVGGSCIAGLVKYEDINIGKGCWICAGAILIPGVTIGDKCVIAAGAVVTSDAPNYALMAGVPAVVKKIYSR